MNCPNCETEMVKRVAILDRRSLNVLFFGLGSSCLLFKEEGGWKKEILSPDDRVRGFHCKDCGATTIGPG